MARKFPEARKTPLGPIYPAYLFERRFRVPRTIFDRLYLATTSCRQYLTLGHNPDATGKFGATALQKIVASMRQLCYGAAADQCDEYTRISETVALLSMKEFAYGVVQSFGSIYLRTPTIEDISRIELKGSFRLLDFLGVLV